MPCWNVFIIRVTVPAKRQVSMFCRSMSCIVSRQVGIGHAFHAAINDGNHAHGGVVNSRHLVDEHFLHAVVGLDGVGKIEAHLERARFVGQFQPIPAGLDSHTVGALDGVAILERAGVLAEHAGRHEFAAGADLLHVLRRFGSHPLRVCRGLLAQDGGRRISGPASICFQAGRRHEHRPGPTRSRAFHLVIQ